jgi:hypothetical protein
VVPELLEPIGLAVLADRCFKAGGDIILPPPANKKHKGDIGSDATERATLMVMDVRASSGDPGAISGDDG